MFSFIEHVLTTTQMYIEHVPIPEYLKVVNQALPVWCYPATRIDARSEISMNTFAVKVTTFLTNSKFKHMAKCNQSIIKWIE